MPKTKFPTYSEITGRPSPNLELSEETKMYYSGKRVLVTGAGGSIGSKISKQLSSMPDIDLLLTDRDENALHTLSLELTDKALFDNRTYELLDIRDSDGINKLFSRENFDLVIHSAALKHLSVLEKQPREALLTNVIGTKNLLNASLKNNVTGFLNISTDKAADPISVLGKSKRAAEIITTESRECREEFTSVRFGNVFASKGSVIETFCFQIIHNLPITLTDPLVSRYFMDIDEAAYLAITALELNCGPVHLLDMGEPILIKEIIDSLQRYFDSKSNIVITGLRSGEKIKENLFSPYESAIPTGHPRIYSLKDNSAEKIMAIPSGGVSNYEAMEFLSLIGDRK
jgi:FlaA1/EpsC-like NDP-sugar epimerase